MIRLDNIGKQNGHQILFIDASMGLQKGEKAGLVGPNGAGKTVGYFSQDVGEMSGKSAVAATMDGGAAAQTRWQGRARRRRGCIRGCRRLMGARNSSCPQVHERNWSCALL